MIDKIKELELEAKEKLESVKDSSKIEELRVEFLGKKGKVIEILKNLKSVEEAKRKEVASKANKLRIEMRLHATSTFRRNCFNEQNFNIKITKT